MFTSHIAWRVGTLAHDINASLPSLDSIIPGMKAGSADVAALNLYAAILVQQPGEVFKPLVEGLMWIMLRCSKGQRNALLSGNLNVDDELAITQEKLVLMQDGKFFYNKFLPYELHGAMLTLMEQFNQLQQTNHLDVNIYATVDEISRNYDDLSLFYPAQEAADALIAKAKQGLALRLHLADYLNKVNALIKQAQEEKFGNKPFDARREVLTGLYRASSQVESNIKVADVDLNENLAEDNFLINTSDITLSSGGKKKQEQKQPSIRGKVLSSLKKSASATQY